MTGVQTCALPIFDTACQPGCMMHDGSDHMTLRRPVAVHHLQAFPFKIVVSVHRRSSFIPTYYYSDFPEGTIIPRRLEQTGEDS